VCACVTLRVQLLCTRKCFEGPTCSWCRAAGVIWAHPQGDPEDEGDRERGVCAKPVQAGGRQAAQAARACMPEAATGGGTLHAAAGTCACSPSRCSPCRQPIPLLAPCVCWLACASACLHARVLHHMHHMRTRAHAGAAPPRVLQRVLHPRRPRHPGRRGQVAQRGRRPAVLLQGVPSRAPHSVPGGAEAVRGGGDASPASAFCQVVKEGALVVGGCRRM